ncbi:MAG TPA: IPT/TIG domain-containing protein [Bryobacteraceae bacterium]|nr:IPT/TIG domain-containing protein [Bryobacteraceae bacterium]
MRTTACFSPLLFVATLYAQDMRIVSVDPATAKVGEIVTVSGEAIDKKNVDMLYLTDGKTDIKVDVTEQSEKSIKFKVPESARGKRWAVMVHTTKDQLIEEPVRVTVQ